jgi:hypothetical protein
VGRPLVITTAFCYGPTEVWPLLHSLEQHAPTAEVLVLTGEEDLKRLAPLTDSFSQLSLETVALPPRVIRGPFALPRKMASRSKRWLRRQQQQFIQKPSIAIEEARRFGLSTAHSHFLIRRFFWAKERLGQERWRHHKSVMLCDVRDVVVQGDPFADIGEALISGEEFGLIDHCAMNRKWVRDAYGSEQEGLLLGKPALCAGVVIGAKEQMDLYLDLFCRDALDMMRRHGTSHEPNLDQAIHNKILRNPSKLQTAISAVNGTIATVGCIPDDAIEVLDNSGRVKVMGQIPTVIHQYDRRSLLVQHVEAKHGRGCGNNSTT